MYSKEEAVIKVNRDSLRKTLDYFGDITISEMLELPASRKEALAIGCDMYFTGSCKYGHIAPRLTCGNVCYICNRAKAKNYYDSNKEEIIKKSIAYIKDRKKNDPRYKVMNLLRTQLTRVLNLAKQDKNGSCTEEILGYSFEDFRESIESKFTSDMTWLNHGTVWELDHIRPIASFNLDDPNEMSFVNSLDNLQPLTVEEHKKKSTWELVNGAYKREFYVQNYY